MSIVTSISELVEEETKMFGKSHRIPKTCFEKTLRFTNHERFEHTDRMT